MPVQLFKDPDRLRLIEGDVLGELIRRGWPAADVPMRANLTHAEMVREVHEAFVRAGADILVTNTSAANAVVCSEVLESGTISAADLRTINRVGAELGRAAAERCGDGDKLVFGAVGPFEALLQLEEIKAQRVSDAYAAQAAALKEGGAQAILCHSFSELEAAVAVVRVVAEACGLPVAATMTFECGPERNETSLGVTVPQACSALQAAGAGIIGCDCGEMPDVIPTVIRSIREQTDVPIWARINAGRSELHEERVVFPESPFEYAGRLALLLEAGARLIGGCCGATVEHIAAIAEAAGVLGRR